MSDALAIAAVTHAIRSLLFREADAATPGTEVTTKPLDKARDGIAGPQLNLFLYHTAIEAAWRNRDMPDVRNGETGFPPLPLNLYYLVTAYGDNDDDRGAHRLLGAAMCALHDHPLLGAAELRATLPDSDLYRQVERVRITNQPMSLEETSKLWTTFQTHYRISAAYEVSVVLIESRRPNGAAPPVVIRGVGDVGVTARPNLLLPFPTLEEVTPATVAAGGMITFAGHDLGGSTIRLRITHRALADPVLTPAAPAPGGNTFQVQLPSGVPAGISTVAALITKDGEEHATNELPLAIRPTVTTPLPLAAARDGSGNVTVVVGVDPQVVAGQQAFLLVSGRQIRPQAFAGPAATLSFRFPAEPGGFPMRLRVGGVDSKLIADTIPPSYDPAQRLVVT